MAYVTINVPTSGDDEVWHCVATYSIQTDNPYGATSPQGRLALTADGGLVLTTERDFEHTHNADNNLNFQEISTTAYFPVITGDNLRLACAARKLNAAHPNFTGVRSCITVVCADEQL